MLSKAPPPCSIRSLGKTLREVKFLLEGITPIKGGIARWGLGGGGAASRRLLRADCSSRSWFGCLKGLRGRYGIMGGGWRE